MGLVGSVSSMGRELPLLDGEAYVVSQAQGPYLWDTTNQRSIDCILGFGSVILGHSPPNWCAELSKTLANGTMPGLANESEQTAAAALGARVAPLEAITFVNSGSEAVQLACRIARVSTGRPRILAMAGGYHGWHDGQRINEAAKRMAASDEPVLDLDSHISLVRFNDIDALETAIVQHSDVAAILLEPILANAGCLMPRPGYLAQVRDLATDHGSLVIADEVLTGFRIRAGLYSHATELAPDLATLGKAIGNGLPVAAVAGKPELMSILSTDLPTAGTANGNPLVCTGVTSTLKALNAVDYTAQTKLVTELRQRLKTVGVSTSGAGLVFTTWFAPHAPDTFSSALKACSQRSSSLHFSLRRRGVMTMPAPLGRLFISFAHDAAVMDQLSNQLIAAVTAL